ncbi:alpha/beta-hydrolase [Decorospora gaudefroyi]|uniref:Alpha/beta-hydrolase n=1 Tax=Decorospora gaudefroyi TaxID=184978 RepID=A0A6A5KBE2_9PLEO|nr:alpha/beta-hydrolase [Decorospora gaudefroyi]
MHCLSYLLAAAVLCNGLSSVTAKPDETSLIERDGSLYNVFEHGATGVKIEYVNNSAICETTLGVKHISGYLSVGEQQDLFFWFFEARNSPATAPLAAWFNGGPGASSMIGLFGENGPCRIQVHDDRIPRATTANNTFSWNNNVNMLYIDQPFGAGFSRGDPLVNSTDSAAPYQRDKISKPISLIALGINNGWHDAVLQYRAYIEFAYNNPYKPFIDDVGYKSMYDAFNNDCFPVLDNCGFTESYNFTESNQPCKFAHYICQRVFWDPLVERLKDIGRDIYDIRQPYQADPFADIRDYLDQGDIRMAIGAKEWEAESKDIEDEFKTTGDFVRSYLKWLSEIVSSGVNTIIWVGDADFSCNWNGVYDVSNHILYPGSAKFSTQLLEPYLVNGKEAASFKTVYNLSFMKVFNAGHFVPHDQPELALQVFEQMMLNGTVGHARVRLRKYLSNTNHLIDLNVFNVILVQDKDDEWLAFLPRRRYRLDVVTDLKMVIKGDLVLSRSAALYGLRNTLEKLAARC